MRGENGHSDGTRQGASHALVSQSHSHSGAHMARKLLTYSNLKIVLGEDVGVLTAILHLAPANLSGYEVCNGRTRGCTAVCLNSAGHGGIGATFDARGNLTKANRVQEARIARTRMLFEQRDAFLAQLRREIAAHIRKAERLNMRPAVRLNGTSDLPVEDWGIIQEYPTVTFYDYTKRRDRMDAYLAGHMPANYSLTFSRAETLKSKLDSMAVLEAGGNVAVVFGGKVLPSSWNGFTVIDGTATDARFTDPRNVIVGLLAKGKARRDLTSGFVVWNA
jgi:hypothetical protein